MDVEAFLTEKLALLQSACDEASKGQIMNARKMETLVEIEAAFRTRCPANEEHFYTVVTLLNKCLEQNPTNTIRSLVVAVLNNLYDSCWEGCGGSSPSDAGAPKSNKKISELQEELEYLLKDCLDKVEEDKKDEKKPSKLKKFRARLSRSGEGGKSPTNKTSNGEQTVNYRIAALYVIGELVVHHKQFVSKFAGDILAVIFKHYHGIFDAAPIGFNKGQCSPELSTVKSLKNLPKDKDGSLTIREVKNSGDEYFLRLNALQTLLKVVYSPLQLPNGVYGLQELYRTFLAKVIQNDKSLENKYLAIMITKILVIKNPQFGVACSDEICKCLFKVLLSFDYSSIKSGGNGLAGVAGDMPQVMSELYSHLVASANVGDGVDSSTTPKSGAEKQDGFMKNMVSPRNLFVKKDSKNGKKSQDTPGDASGNAGAKGAAAGAVSLNWILFDVTYGGMAISNGIMNPVSTPSNNMVQVDCSNFAETLLLNGPMLLSTCHDLMACVLTCCCNQDATRQHMGAIEKKQEEKQRKQQESWFGLGGSGDKKDELRKPLCDTFGSVLQYILSAYTRLCQAVVSADDVAFLDVEGGKDATKKRQTLADPVTISQHMNLRSSVMKRGTQPTVATTAPVTSSTQNQEMKVILATVLVRFCAYFQSQVQAGSSPFADVENPNNPNGEYEVYSRGIDALLALLVAGTSVSYASQECFYTCEHFSLCILALIQAATEKNIESRLLGRFVIGTKLRISETDTTARTQSPAVVICCLLNVIAESFHQLKQESMMAIDDSISVQQQRPKCAPKFFVETLLMFAGHHTPAVQLKVAEVLKIFVSEVCQSQLSPTVNLLLNHLTVHNAEVLGVSASGKDEITPQLIQPLHELVGSGVSLAAVVSTLRPSEVGSDDDDLEGADDGLQDSILLLGGIPNDMTNAVFNSCKALLQPHPDLSLFDVYRKSIAFLLFESLMALGSAWIARRLSTLFNLWKPVLNRKAMDRLKQTFSEELAPQIVNNEWSEGIGKKAIAGTTPSSKDTSPASTHGAGKTPGTDKGGEDTGPNVQHKLLDDLMPVYCSMRSIYAFVYHGNSLLTDGKRPHLPKFVVGFLTSVSQMVLALPHPCTKEFTNLQTQEMAARSMGVSASTRGKTFGSLRTKEGQGPPNDDRKDCFSSFESLNVLSFNYGEASTICELLLGIRALIYKCFALLDPIHFQSRAGVLLHMVADDLVRREQQFACMRVLKLRTAQEDNVVQTGHQNYIGCQSLLGCVTFQRFMHRASYMSLRDTGPLEAHRFFGVADEQRQDPSTYGYLSGLYILYSDCCMSGLDVGKTTALAGPDYGVATTVSSSSQPVNVLAPSKTSFRGILSTLRRSLTAKDMMLDSANADLTFLSTVFASSPGLFSISATEKLVCPWLASWYTCEESHSPEWDWVDGGVKLLNILLMSPVVEEDIRVQTLKHFVGRLQRSIKEGLLLETKLHIVAVFGNFIKNRIDVFHKNKAHKKRIEVVDEITGMGMFGMAINATSETNSSSSSDDNGSLYCTADLARYYHPEIASSENDSAARNSSTGASREVLNFEQESINALLEAAFEGAKHGQGQYRRLMSDFLACLFYYYIYIEEHGAPKAAASAIDQFTSLSAPPPKKEKELKKELNKDHPVVQKILNWLNFILKGTMNARSDTRTANTIGNVKCTAITTVVNILTLFSKYHSHVVPTGMLTKKLKKNSSACTERSSAMVNASADDGEVSPTKTLCVGGTKKGKPSSAERSSSYLSAELFNSVFEILVGYLLRAAKETEEPVRSHMLHAINVVMGCCGWTYFPHLKDTLRLAAAHLLADNHENPLITCIMGEILLRSSSDVTSEFTPFNNNLNKDLLNRLSNVWQELRRTVSPWVVMQRCGSRSVSMRAYLHVLKALQKSIPSIAVSKKLLAKVCEDPSSGQMGLSPTPAIPSSSSMDLPIIDSDDDSAAAYFRFCRDLLLNVHLLEDAFQPSTSDQQKRSKVLFQNLASNFAGIQYVALETIVSLINGRLAQKSLFAANGGAPVSVSSVLGPMALGSSALGNSAPRTLQFSAASNSSTKSVVMSLLKLPKSEIESFLNQVIQYLDRTSDEHSRKLSQDVLLMTTFATPSITETVSTNATGKIAAFSSALSKESSAEKSGANTIEVDGWVDRIHQIVTGFHRRRRCRKEDVLEHVQEKKEEVDKGDDDSKGIVQREEPADVVSKDFAPPPFMGEPHFHLHTKLFMLKMMRRILNNQEGAVSMKMPPSMAKKFKTVVGTASGGDEPGLSLDLLSPQYAEKFLEGRDAANHRKKVRMTAKYWESQIDILLSISTYAINDGETMPELQTEGLRTLLSVVRLFEFSTDAHQRRFGGQATFIGFNEDETDTEEHPDAEPFLQQFEAQIGAAARKCCRLSTTTPMNLYVASLILFEIMRTKVTSDPDRMLEVLAGPVGKPNFQYDENCCERATTFTYLQRIRCAAKLLRVLDKEECNFKPIKMGVTTVLQDLLVGLANLSSTPLKMWAQPTESCFVAGDAFILRDAFKEALPDVMQALAICDKENISRDHVLGVIANILQEDCINEKAAEGCLEGLSIICFGEGASRTPILMDMFLYFWKYLSDGNPLLLSLSVKLVMVWQSGKSVLDGTSHDEKLKCLVLKTARRALLNNVSQKDTETALAVMRYFLIEIDLHPDENIRTTAYKKASIPPLKAAVSQREAAETAKSQTETECQTRAQLPASPVKVDSPKVKSPESKVNSTVKPSATQMSTLEIPKKEEDLASGNFASSDSEDERQKDVIKDSDDDGDFIVRKLSTDEVVPVPKDEEESPVAMLPKEEAPTEQKSPAKSENMEDPFASIDTEEKAADSFASGEKGKEGFHAASPASESQGAGDFQGGDADFQGAGDFEGGNNDDSQVAGDFQGASDFQRVVTTAVDDDCAGAAASTEGDHAADEPTDHIDEFPIAGVLLKAIDKNVASLPHAFLKFWKLMIGNAKERGYFVYLLRWCLSILKLMERKVKSFSADAKHLPQAVQLKEAEIIMCLFLFLVPIGTDAEIVSVFVKKESSSPGARLFSTFLRRFKTVLRPIMAEAPLLTKCVPPLQALLRSGNGPLYTPLILPLVFEDVEKVDRKIAWTLLGACCEGRDASSLHYILEMASVELLGGETVPSPLGTCILAIAKSNAAVFKETLISLPDEQRDVLQQGLRQQVAVGG